MNLKFSTTTIFFSALSLGATMAQAKDASLAGAHYGVSKVIATNVDANDMSYFDEVAEWFDGGKEVTFEDVRGAWSGRCFEKVAQKTANNSLLLSYEKNQLGPGFAGQQYLGQIVHNAYGPDYFDNYDIIADVENAKGVFMDGIMAKQFSAASETDGMLGWTRDFEPNGRTDLSYKIRMNKDFLVVQSTNLINGNIIYSNSLGKSIHGVSQGVWSNCYYFKNLENQDQDHDHDQDGDQGQHPGI